MTEDVAVVGDDPTLSVRVTDSINGTASFGQLRGKRDLIFEYKVVDGENCTAATTVASPTCHIALNGITVRGFASSHASIMDVGGNGCTDATCGYTWPRAPSGKHGVDARLSGDQKLTPLEEATTPTAQTVNPVGTAVVRSTTPSGGYYTSGDTIRIEVPLSPAVTFTSAPQLLLDLDEGGRPRLTAEGSFSSSGTERTNLVFNYRVTSGDEDVNGFTGTLSVGGTPTVEDGRRVSLGSVSVPSSIRIDALAPDIEPLRITSNAGSDGTYVAEDRIEVTATFSEPVRRTSVGEEPELTIRVGGEERTATLQSPAASATDDEYVFRYTVAAGDNGDVTIAGNALESSLEDAAGNAADDGLPAVAASTSHRVDTQGPVVSLLAVTGAGDDNLFLEGETITATVTFDEDVNVETSGSNAVRVRFGIGTLPRAATYEDGDGTKTLTFTYQVVAGDSGRISFPANALEGEAGDRAGNAAESTGVGYVTDYRVDASAPMLVGAPSISSSPASGDTCVEGETIAVKASFDEPVIVTGEPRLPMTVGKRLRNIVRYTSGSGGDTLTFTYTVLKGDMDDDGVSIAANALRLPSGATIRDLNGLAAGIAHGELADQPGHKVDAVAPGIESLAITSSPASGDAYLIGERIEVTATFSEAVSTNGSPTLGIMMGTGSRDATCARGGDRTELTCSYTVAANDFDPNGVSVNANSLSGTVTDVPGNAATLTHKALADDPDHKVHAAAPEAVRSIATLSMAAGGATNSLDLTGIFTGFQLAYSASSSNESVAVASVAGSELTVRSGMEGTATVTVTASNPAGECSATIRPGRRGGRRGDALAAAGVRAGRCRSRCHDAVGHRGSAPDDAEPRGRRQCGSRARDGQRDHGRTGRG